MDRSTWSLSPTKREKAWMYLKEHGTTTTRELVDAVGIGQSAAQKLMKELYEEGIVTREKRGRSYLYELPEVPSRRPAVVESVASWRQQAWNALRVHRKLTVPTAMASMSDDVSITFNTAAKYFRLMEKAGVILKRGRAGKKGQPRSHTIYALHPAHDRPDHYPDHKLRDMAEEASDNG